MPHDLVRQPSVNLQTLQLRPHCTQLIFTAWLGLKNTSKPEGLEKEPPRGGTLQNALHLGNAQAVCPHEASSKGDYPLIHPILGFKGQEASPTGVNRLPLRIQPLRSKEKQKEKEGGGHDPRHQGLHHRCPLYRNRRDCDTSYGTRPGQGPDQFGRHGSAIRHNESTLQKSLLAGCLQGPTSLRAHEKRSPFFQLGYTLFVVKAEEWDSEEWTSPSRFDKLELVEHTSMLCRKDSEEDHELVAEYP
ncbi:hypothetical protein Cgig2_010420 [Carnegiea gigantea]|uniref:Uncharacterized protein n=1 Tax=Carnegiea gigantea TaxID=171969 RepID=A0A9Q1JJS6_9CARY|nr:hypothetical protein Cgig2_010420 [Carnegiea gigantea]